LEAAFDRGSSLSDSSFTPFFFFAEALAGVAPVDFRFAAWLSFALMAFASFSAFFSMLAFVAASFVSGSSSESS
jgi:hypothetical protein